MVGVLDGLFQEARSTLETAAEYAADLRMRSADVALAYLRGLIESAAGKHQDAAGAFDRARQILVAAGQPEGEALMAAYASRERAADGQPVPGAYAALADADFEDLADPRLGALCRVLCARAAAESGHPARSLALSAAALECADRMDDLYFRGTVYRDVAELRDRAGDAEGARAAAGRALEFFTAKGAQAALRTGHGVPGTACGPQREEDL